jgi:hypothetical protein
MLKEALPQGSPEGVVAADWMEREAIPQGSPVNVVALVRLMDYQGRYLIDQKGKECRGRYPTLKGRGEFPSIP